MWGHFAQQSRSSKAHYLDNEKDNDEQALKLLDPLLASQLWLHVQLMIVTK